VNLTLFLSTMAFLEAYPAPRDISPMLDHPANKTAKERINERLDSTFYTALTRNWMVWPAVQLVNFSVVPLDHRVLVVNVVALGWNCYLSYLNNKGAVDKEEEQKEEEQKVEGAKKKEKEEI
jgi:hypothetical protein